MTQGDSRSATAWAPASAPWSAFPSTVPTPGMMGFNQGTGTYGYSMGYGYGAPGYAPMGYPGYAGMPSGYPMQGYGWPAQAMTPGGVAQPMYRPVGYTPTPGDQGWMMPAYWYNPGSR